MDAICTIPQEGPEMRDLRQKAGVSIDEVCAELEMPATTISRIERGTRPVPEGLPERYYGALLRITDMRVQALLSGSPDQP